jgi:hypothetical protein
MPFDLYSLLQCRNLHFPAATLLTPDDEEALYLSLIRDVQHDGGDIRWMLQPSIATTSWTFQQTTLRNDNDNNYTNNKDSTKKKLRLTLRVVSALKELFRQMRQQEDRHLLSTFQKELLEDDSLMTILVEEARPILKVLKTNHPRILSLLLLPMKNN